MANANKMNSATKVKVLCRIFFANIFEPKSINGGEAKYVFCVRGIFFFHDAVYKTVHTGFGNCVFCGQALGEHLAVDGSGGKPWVLRFHMADVFLAGVIQHAAFTGIRTVFGHKPVEAGFEIGAVPAFNGSR